MTKLALSDEILMKIDKPARYIGNELNSIKKDKEKVAIRFAMCFPDVYEIGMSHLGVQILYDMFNKMEDVWCERVYSPWPDLHKIMKEEHIPLFGLESQEPIKNLDFIGFTLNYEMCYTNVLQILDLGQIPLLAKDRTEDDPLVIGGGCCTYNPEPMADFFDLFYMGEGEISFYELFDLYKKMRAEGKTRHEFLHEASKVPGIYVPSLYEVTYKEDGTIASFEPIYEDVPKTIQKQIVLNMTEAVYRKTCRSFYQSNTGSCGSRDPARMYPWLPFLPGWNGLPSGPRKKCRTPERSCLQNVKINRTRRDFFKLFKFLRLF